MVICRVVMRVLLSQFEAYTVFEFNLPLKRGLSVGIPTCEVCSHKVPRRNKIVTKNGSKVLNLVTHCEPLNKILIVQNDFC